MTRQIIFKRFSHPLAVVIGFIDAPYVAFENDGFATVTFGVVDGTLEGEVAVNLSFTSASSIGELTLFLTSIFITCIFFSWRGFPS